MTHERAIAYAQVTRVLEGLGPAKLHVFEQRRIRAAADTLVLAETLDPPALDALADIESLTRHLRDCGRFTAELARQLADAVASCGPQWAEATLQSCLAAA